MSVFDIPGGTKVQSMINIPDFPAELPVTTIRGTEPGPNVLITAGIHNEEYTGIETANRFAAELTPEEIKGAVTIIHICNPTGFASIAADVVPEDGKNLNRVFPGNADGSLSHRLAHFILQDFIRPADYLIDLHSGGGREELVPHNYFQRLGGKKLSERSLALASCMDADYTVATNVLTGSSFTHASAYNVPAILMERGQMATWNETDVQDYMDDLRRILHSVGTLSKSRPQRRIPRVIETTTYYDAEAEGCWYHARNVGETVAEGEPLGEIRDPFGNVLSVVHAKRRGVVLFQLGSYSVRDGEFLVCCGDL